MKPNQVSAKTRPIGGDLLADKEKDYVDSTTKFLKELARKLSRPAEYAHFFNQTYLEKILNIEEPVKTNGPNNLDKSQISNIHLAMSCA